MLCIRMGKDGSPSTIIQPKENRLFSFIRQDPSWCVKVPVPLTHCAQKKETEDRPLSPFVRSGVSRYPSP